MLTNSVPISSKVDLHEVRGSTAVVVYASQSVGSSEMS